MKVLLISGSPHREESQTFSLAHHVLSGASVDSLNTKVLHLCDYRIDFCYHKERCHQKLMDCPIEDDVGMILEEMLLASGIIIASPNYINQVTALMKALFDRSNHFIHCKRLLGKYVIGVVSSGSGQNKDVLDYIRFYANTCGAQYAGGVSSQVPVGKEKKKEAEQLGKRLTLDLENKTEYPKQIATIQERKEYFKQIIIANKDRWIGEYQYWQNQSWL